MAASIPRQYYHSDRYANFSHEFFGLSNIPATSTDASIEETPNIFSNNNNAAAISLKPLVGCDDINSSPVSMFPDQQFGVNPAALSEWEMGFCHYKNLQACGSTTGEDQCCGSMPGPNYWPAYHMAAAADNWGVQSKQVAKFEESEVKVGRYSVEERKDRILRYLKKRNQRNFTKTIKYACRKTLADKRVRIRGRFAKNNEPCEDDNTTKTLTAHSFEQNISFYEDDSLQMIYNDDDCLQAAMAGLVYLPYMAG